MLTLGIGAFGRDSSVVLVDETSIVTAIDKEKLLLHKFGERAPAPVLFYTSFNPFGEPLVSDPCEAMRSFYCAGIDALAIGEFFVIK